MSSCRDVEPVIPRKTGLKFPEDAESNLLIWNTRHFKSQDILGHNLSFPPYAKGKLATYAIQC